MSRNKKPKTTAQRQWEDALVQAYYDYRWHQLLDPLYEQMQSWKRGELEHEDINQAVHQTNKQSRVLYNLFSEKRDFLILLAQADQEWFDYWVAQHPVPAEVTVHHSLLEREAESE